MEVATEEVRAVITPAGGGGGLREAPLDGQWAGKGLTMDCVATRSILGLF